MKTEPFVVKSSHKIVGFPDGNIISICPTIDLLVISMNKMSLWIFRLDGERIYAINNKLIIKHLCWNPDGKTFAVSGIDGKVKLYDTNTGGFIKEFKFSDPSMITCSDQEIITDDSPLFDVDLLNQLPILNGFDNFNAINYLLVTSNDQILMIFNNLLLINIPISYKVIHSSSIDLWTHLYITETNEIVKLTIPRIQIVPRLILIFCKIKTILENVNSDLAKLVEESNKYFTTFDRYLLNYYENLAENPQGSYQEKADNIKTSLQKILLTQIIPKNLSDYWLNQFGERGHTRLLKQGTDTFDLIRNLIFKSIIQYLEKLLVILNDLKSIIEWNSIHSIDITISPDQIQLMIDRVQTYLKKSFQFIWDINKEQVLFNQFMNWIKYLIDSLVKEKYQEEPSKTDIPSSKLLDYINTMLMNSTISKYLSLSSLEVFTFASPQVNIIDEWTQLSNVIDDGLFKPFERYFNSKVIISLPRPIGSPNCKVYIIGGPEIKKQVVISSSKTEIKVIDSEEHVERTIHIDELIDYQVYNGNLLMVHKRNEYFLERYNILDLLNDTGEAISKQMDGRPKLLVVNKDREYGYLFEENIKDYNVILL